ncbi:13069_t:CDS:2, partial [Ambispora leptoticha]
MTADSNQQQQLPSLLNYCQKYIPEPHITKWFNIIINSYSEPHRYYHTINHITRMLNLFEEFKEKIVNDKIMVLAILFHDIVYDPKKFNHNEVESIKLFDEYAQEVELTATEREHVSLFITATIHHELPLFAINNNDNDVDGRNDDNCIREDLKLFLDLDLEVLKYDEYAKQIRQEYIHYSTKDFSIGRAKVLEKFLARDNLYFSRIFLEKRSGCEMDAQGIRQHSEAPHRPRISISTSADDFNNNMMQRSLSPRSPSPSLLSSSSYSGTIHRGRATGSTTYQSNPHPGNLSVGNLPHYRHTFPFARNSSDRIHSLRTAKRSQTTIDYPSIVSPTATYSTSSFDNFESNDKTVRSRSPESSIPSAIIPTLPKNSQQKSNRRRSSTLYYPPPPEYPPQVTREQELNRYSFHYIDSCQINNAIPLSKRSLTGYTTLRSRDSMSYENRRKL